MANTRHIAFVVCVFTKRKKEATKMFNDVDTIFQIGGRRIIGKSRHDKFVFVAYDNFDNVQFESLAIKLNLERCSLHVDHCEVLVADDTRELSCDRFDAHKESVKSPGTSLSVTTRQNWNKPYTGTIIQTVHGFRSEGNWQDTLKDKWNSSEVTVRRGDFERWDILRFWLPFTRRGAVKRVADALKSSWNEAQKRNAKYVIIAHSFGTYLVIKALADSCHFIRPNKIILCCSIVPRDYQFKLQSWFNKGLEDQIRRNEESFFIVNERGGRDWYPALAQGTTWGFGASGCMGFSQQEGILERLHDTEDHGLIEDSDLHSEWKQWLLHDIELTRPDTKDQVSRPWISRLASCYPLKYFIVTAFTAALTWGAHQFHWDPAALARAAILLLLVWCILTAW